jgi:hypothetical protein
MLSEPFLIHLTVFKSRLGLANLLLDCCSPASQTELRLTRRVLNVIEFKKDLPLTEKGYDHVFRYLSDDKKLIGKSGFRDKGKGRKGRYAQYKLKHTTAKVWEASHRRDGRLKDLPVYQTDFWMAHPDVPSTIGAPTPDNVQEVLELCQQLEVVSKARHAWTTAGYAAARLRKYSRDNSSKHLGDAADNPFLLGAEAVVFWRQLFELDGVILREILRAVSTESGTIKKDDVVKAFPTIVERALAASKKLPRAKNAQRKGADFAKLVRDSLAKRGKALQASPSTRGRVGVGHAKTTAAPKGPGMLEHRVSPRLEWLSDMGCLKKAGQKKNAFEYRLTDSGRTLLQRFDDIFESEEGLKSLWPEELAITQWEASDAMSSIRRELREYGPRPALVKAYELIRPRMGPSPIRDVVLAASVMTKDAMSVDDLRTALFKLSEEVPGVTVTGGRYVRTPVNIHMTEAALDDLRGENAST